MAARDPRLARAAVIAAGVLLLDQATKIQAVTHLTPGIAEAHLAPASLLDRAHARQVVKEIGLVERIRHYFARVESPCAGRGTLCPEVRVIDGFWSWRYAENRGAAWSLLGNAPDAVRLPILLGFTAVALFALLQMLRKLKEEQRLLRLALPLILGGALGNFFDRVHQGYVVDFILWYYGDFRWPTFNVADVAISTGLGLVLLDGLLGLRVKRALPALR